MTALSPAWTAGALVAGLALAVALGRQVVLRRRAERALDRTTAERDRLLAGLPEAEQRLQALGRQHEALKLTMNTHAIVSVADRSGTIVDVNDAFCRISGHAREALLGQDHRIVNSGVHPPEFWRAMWGTIARGSPWRGQICNRAKDGSLYWVDSMIAPLAGADGRIEKYVSVRFDITALHAMQAEVENSARLLRGAIDAIDEAFVLFGPDDRLVFCNDKYRAIYASSADLIVPGATFESIVRGGAERGQYRDAIGRVDEWVAERMVAHRSGDATLVQRIDSGRTLRIVERRMPDGHLVGFRIDITDLVRAKEAAEQGSRAKSEFIATISHELRTPLQSVLGFSELGEQFAMSQANTRLQHMFARIQDGGERMLRLVNSLLDLSTIDTTEGSLALERCDLVVLVSDVVDALRAQAARRDVSIGLDAPAAPLPMEVDVLRLQQALRNVLANALRVAPEDSVVDVAMHLGQGVEITVRDHGPGIPPDELEAVFYAFVQSSRTRDNSGGTGLGLTIARKIMVAHGGSLQAENADGGGALLRLRLPGRTASPAGAPPPALDAAAPGGAPAAPG